MASAKAKTTRRLHPIEVGCDIAARLNRLLKTHAGDGRLFVCLDANFHRLHGKTFLHALEFPRSRFACLIVPSGERVKSTRGLKLVHDFLLDGKIARDDFVLACGGGVTTDLVGYAAATVLRGVRWGAVPTTLLGMVDASIGGKTAINHRLGKNLIGVFWQPAFVLADTRFLSTLPMRHIICGLGEILKYAGLTGDKILSMLESYIIAGQPYHNRYLTRLVRLSAGYKGDIAARDEREAGLRMILNYGHTFGHAVEKAAGFSRLLHGEAVILGIHTALILGELLGYHSRKLVAYQELVGELVNVVPYRKIDTESVMDAMTLDKKRLGTSQRFVLIERPGKPIICSNVDRHSVITAIERTLEVYRLKGGKDAHTPGC